MIKIKRFATKSMVNVTIKWEEGILVDKFKNDYLSAKEQKIVQTDNVIYIFVGNSKKGDAVDVGQTSRSLEVRTKEHIDKGDYLEKFPNDQIVYCGEVKCGKVIDRDLLEQIEGAIIREMSTKEGFTLCNDNKVNDYKKNYKIEEIKNENRTGDLKDLLKIFIYPDR